MSYLLLRQTRRYSMKTLRLYIGHATQGFNYKNTLYVFLKKSAWAKNHSLILPHDNNTVPIDSKKLFTEAKQDLIMLADLSAPSTGLGMEIFWAKQYSIPVIFCAQEGSNPTSAVKFVWERDGKGRVSGCWLGVVFRSGGNCRIHYPNGYGFSCFSPEAWNGWWTFGKYRCTGRYYAKGN